jgi:HAMP domain-containing protein
VQGGKMFYSKLKITTKLIISSAVFLIPIGIMLWFISSFTVGIIKKSDYERTGINALKPAITVIQYLPEYFNVYLGIKPGSLATLDGQITDAVKILDREARRYMKEGRELPEILTEWEALKKIESSDPEIYQKYSDFASSLNTLIRGVGEYSTLILVLNMDNYYLVTSALSGMPEASMRLFSTGSLIRRNLHDAENVIVRWNNDLAAAQAQGRRLTARPYEGNPHDIILSMIASEDLQIVRYNRILLESDRDRIIANLKSAMEENEKNAGGFSELTKKLEQYQKTVDVLFEQFTRIGFFNVTHPATAVEVLDTISQLNTDLCELWTETFISLDMQIQHNGAAAQRALVVYMMIVLVSLVLAFGFVIIIMLDINRSVKNLKTLFKGLYENDLTLSLKVNSRDEFGELMTAFNGFLSVLRSTFGSFKQSAQLVANSVFDIS